MCSKDLCFSSVLIILLKMTVNVIKDEKTSRNKFILMMMTGDNNQGMVGELTSQNIVIKAKVNIWGQVIQEIMKMLHFCAPSEEQTNNDLSTCKPMLTTSVEYISLHMPTKMMTYFDKFLLVLWRFFLKMFSQLFLLYSFMNVVGFFFHFLAS